MSKKKKISVLHMSAEEASTKEIRKVSTSYNPYTTGHGAWGDTKYNRTKAKRSWKKELCY